MKYLKKGLMTIMMIGILTTQSGCITGLAIGNVPLALGGLGLWAVGYVAKIPLFALSGIALDAENTDRMDVLNPLPLDQAVANMFEVSVEDLALYNNELNGVLAADQVITSVLRRAYENKFITETEMNEMASRVGLSSGSELMNILQGEQLSRNDLEKFSAAFEISPLTAQMYLKKRWSINIEKR